ncbi:MAG: hypothetical protein Q4P18_08335 [Methanobrevibacter sp.]|uniref:hypothetical protein n=1 Tax=Methanobrevibacter sp. TaxID=66852 RepID=UPI0026E00894|nr:hypothetical protein [Methanobrevibacter sp.]MDO5849530.1 hypothetical protein [Methanobrevibacter sp.]
MCNEKTHDEEKPVEKEVKFFHDKTQKFLFDYFSPDFLKAFDIEYTFKQTLNTEIIAYGKHTLRMDVLIETEEGILLNIEFQSTSLDKSVLRRFFEYAYFSSLKYEGAIESYVISTKVKKSTTKYLSIAGKFDYPFEVIALKEIDGGSLLDVLEYKMENGIDLENPEIVKLSLIGYTSFDQSFEEIFIRAITILNNVKTLNIVIIKDIKYIMEMQYRRLAKRELEGELKEVFNMGPSILEEGIEIGILKMVEKMLDKGYPIDDISEMSGLSVDEIFSLKNSK